MNGIMYFRLPIRHNKIPINHTYIFVFTLYVIYIFYYNRKYFSIINIILYIYNFQIYFLIAQYIV